jgi:hypothetical protein
MNLDFTTCPNCKQEASKLWEVFVFPSRFYINKTCRSCEIPIRLNPKLLRSLLVFLIAGIVIVNILSQIVNIKIPGFDTLLIIGFLFIPLLTIKQLFVIDESRASSGS